jgi:hypothetical protein
VAAVAFAQIWQRADQAELAAHPDEAAHFVSAVCLQDYCKTALGSSPVRFAESYYVRYPKIAFGHWPPLFFVLQALWYAVAGASPFHAVLLTGAILAATGVVLFLYLHRLHGFAIALLSTGVFLSIPTVRWTAALVMSDMLAALLMLLAVLALERRAWKQFAIWAVLAILTKESALALLVLAPVALPRQRASLVRIAGGFAVLAAVLAGAYWVAGVLRLRDLPQVAASWGEFAQRLPLLDTFFQGASLPMFLTAGLGAVLLAIRPAPERTRQGKIALLWLCVILASQLLARTALEERYVLAAYLPLTVLFAEGLRRLPGSLLAFAWTIVCIALSPGEPYSQRTGYAEIAAAIPSDPRSPAILVSSDASGEGALIAARLLRDPDRDGLILRGSKVLSKSDWSGENAKPRFQSAQEVLALLDSIPIHFLVVDRFGYLAVPAKAHHRLLEDAIRADPARFRRIGDYPLFLDGKRLENAVQVYENLRASANPTGVLRIDMTSSLGRKLELRWNPNRRTSPPTPSAARLLLPGWLPRYRDAEPIRLAPDREQIAAEGGWGRVYVTSPPGQVWTVRGLPPWIAGASPASGHGDGVFAYSLLENLSAEDRWAELGVGSRFSRVTQPGVFRSANAHLEDLPGAKTKLTATSEGPDGGDALLLERPDPPDEAPATTSAYFSRVPVEAGRSYRLSLWVRAQQRGRIWLRFAQDAIPFNGCGLNQPVEVSPEWKQAFVTFRIKGDGCGTETNRLSIDAGQISGNLWVSQIALHPVPD